MSYYQSNNFLNNIPVVTRNILIINSIIWLACYLIRFLPGILGLYDLGSGYFRLYQLVTYMFTHESFSHLFFNMFGLFMFGQALESYWGPKRFFTYYMVTGIGAGLIQLLICYLQSAHAITIGASGSIFGILLAFGMIFPNIPLYIMFIPIPIKAKYMVIGYGLLELYFGFANRMGDNVAHFAHLGGMLFGILLILYWRKNGHNYRQNFGYRNDSILQKISKVFKKKPTGKNTYNRPETDWEYNARRAEENRNIDRILEKIKYSGYNSLSEEEKQKLFDAGKNK